MQNWQSFKKEIILLCAGLVLVVLAISANFNPSITQALKSDQMAATPTPTPDPGKDFSSLDNYISYFLPALWHKSDNVDLIKGTDSYLKLISPDFDSPQPLMINSGVGIVVNRTYDLKAEESLKSKLDTAYGFDTYNVMAIKIGGKNAMTMHQDGQGHHRSIYIASGNHLWEISIASKSLEDESRYEGDIENFLKSISFKDN